MSTMPVSKKEEILAKIESRIKGIKADSVAYGDIKYANTVGYVDRQFINITPADIQQHGTNWVVINEVNEEWKPLVGGPFENKILVQIVGFVQALKESDNLGSLVNSLQKDIMLAMLKDVELDRLCSYLVPVSSRLVDSMIYPYAGFMLYFSIVYVTQGFEI